MTKTHTQNQQQELPQNVWGQSQIKQKSHEPQKLDSKPDLTNMKIMVIDDVPLNVKLACSLLSISGYKNFIKQSDSTKALMQIYQENSDVLLLDMMMPKVSGLDILEAVRADHHFSHLPILILTASTENDMKNKALQLGATDFLHKPIYVQDLLPRVRNALMMKMYQDHLEPLAQ